jgi:hypothetical protein
MSTGCSSVKTTLVGVSPEGDIYADPHRCVHGVPAMIKVPTHIEVKIIQTDYWKVDARTESSVKHTQQEPEEDSDEADSLVIRTLIHRPASTLRNVEVKEICTDKMVMIDPKRPASGQGEFAIKYDDDGNGTILSLNYKAVDETLKNSAALASALVKAFPTSEGKTNLIGQGTQGGSFKSTRTIAIQRFPIGNCSQSEIESFVTKYINACGPVDCTNPTMYAPAKTEGGK